MKWPVLAVGAVLLAACGLLEPDEARELAILRIFHDQAPVVEVPDSVDATAPFMVRFESYGTDGCYRAGENEVHHGPDRVLIRAYDYHPVGDHVFCPGTITTIAHEVWITLVTAGTFTVEVQGRAPPADLLLRVERTVVVR